MDIQGALGGVDFTKYALLPIIQYAQVSNIGNPNFSNLLKRIVNRFKRAGYILDIMRQTACLVLTQSWLKAMLHSLVARRWFRPQTQ